MHGYPDNHTVWDGVAALLADRFHVVTYDVRGAGASDKPGARGAYRLDRLVDDLVAVVDAVSPSARCTCSPTTGAPSSPGPSSPTRGSPGRVASFTSISGPSLDQSGAWLRTCTGTRCKSVRQLAHSYYIGLFQLPGLPELAARCGVLDRVLAPELTRHPQPARRRAPNPPAVRPTSQRARAVPGATCCRGSRDRARVPIDLPVQVIVPEHDAFVTADLAVDAARPWVANLTVQRVAGGHWVVSERPEVVARLVGQFVDGPATTRTPRRPPHRSAPAGSAGVSSWSPAVPAASAGPPPWRSPGRAPTW